MAFGEASAVGPQDQGDVRKERRFGAERAVEQNLLGRIGNVIGAANYVCDTHINVIDYGAQLIGGQGESSARASSGAEQHEIFDLVVLNFAGAEDDILKTGGRTERHAEADRRILIFSGRLA